MRTIKRMDMPLNNVTVIIRMVKNAHTVTRRVTETMSSGRQKKVINININKWLISLKIYILENLFWK